MCAIFDPDLPAYSAVYILLRLVHASLIHSQYHNKQGVGMLSMLTRAEIKKVSILYYAFDQPTTLHPVHSRISYSKLMQETSRSFFTILPSVKKRS